VATELATGPIPARFDRETEIRFQHVERMRLRPSVRAYAAVLAAALLLYTVANTIFFSREGDVISTLLLVPSLAVLGGYFAATYWERYPDQPAIDFASLLLLGLIVLADNVLLAEEIERLDLGMHVGLALETLIVSAFAALALAANVRWFLVWLSLNALGFAAMTMIIEATVAGLIYAALSYLSGAAVALVINWALGRAHRAAFVFGLELQSERDKTEELLYNVLPQAAAERLRQGEVVADSFSDASVVFIDVVGFSQLAKTVSPGHLVDLLNAFFSLADRCAAESGVEKVKTIGDAYLAISGGNAPARNSAQAALAFAEAVIEGLHTVRDETGLEIAVRIGIHSGPLVGGVIGATRMAYDYWGETMNIASRIESVAEPNGIAVSESTYLRAQGSHAFTSPKTILLKGVGEMPVYRVAGRV
jgi:adenylate cyclase